MVNITNTPAVNEFKAVMPEQAPPSVVVNVPQGPAPVVNVTVPEQKPPDVNVVVERPAINAVVTRDSQGRIKGINGQ